MKHITLTIGLLTVLSACASSSDEISTAYVSPLQYENYSCTQLRQEGERVSARASQLAGHLDQKSTDDAIATGVGVVLFWPVLFMIDGDGPEAQEYARLKGEREAVEKVAIQKNCGIRFKETAKTPS